MAGTVNVTARRGNGSQGKRRVAFYGPGMSLAAAFDIFARQTLRQGKIPFEIYVPFSGVKNQEDFFRPAKVEAAKAKLIARDFSEVDGD
jgi:DNA-damage-inducible protein J